jgi:Aspartyl protease
MDRSMSARFLFGWLNLFWLLTGTARAETCAPLQLLDQIQMVAVNDATTMLVPVTINGVDKLMIFDTGASASSVTRASARELGLSVHPGIRGTRLYDVYGDQSRDVTTIGEFKFGRQDIGDARFRIWPNPDLDNVDERLAGVLARDQLSQFDIDLDFPNATLKLFSPEHCEGKILYWKAAAIGVGEFDTRANHINISATLDGQKLSAIIDTGAVSSVLSAEAARRFFGLTADSPGMTRSAILARNPQYSVYQRQFSELDFNGVSVSSPVIAIWPNIINRNADKSLQDTHNRAIPMSVVVNPSELIIGMDILRKLHIYIAIREHRTYISEASANSPASK